MNPQIDTSPEGPLLMHKQAMREMMDAEYKRALRRQAMLQEQRTTRTATHVMPAPLAAPMTPAPLTGLLLTATEMAATETPVLTTPPPPLVPVAKKRKGLLGTAVAAHKLTITPTEKHAQIDITVKAEIDKFSLIKQGILSGIDEKENHIILVDFWSDHKKVLPLHFGVYVSEVGCKKAALANVETVFSGAGKFTEEAKSTGSTLLRRVVKLHYNWKYKFLRPSTEQVTKRYKDKWPGAAGRMAAMAAKAAATVNAAAAASSSTADAVSTEAATNAAIGGD